MMVYLGVGVLCGALLVLALVFDFDTVDALDAHDGHGESLFSVRSVLAFGTGFGASGAITAAYGTGVTGTAVVAALSGAAMLWASVAFGRFLHAQEGDSTVRVGSMLGRTGRVTVAVGPLYDGEVAVTDSTGRAMSMRARASHAIQAGSVVTVGAVIGDVLIVTDSARS